MKYMLHYQWHNRPKNQIEAELYDQIKLADRKVFDQDTLNLYKTYLFGFVEGLARKHKRCTPVKLSFPESQSSSGDVSIFVGTGDTSTLRATFLRIGSDAL